MSKQKSKILTIVLLVYIYLPFFWNILEYTFKVPFFVEYIIFIILMGIIILVTPQINKKMLAFLFVFVLLIIINFCVVDYRYYVAIEGGQAICWLAIPCLCIVNKHFNLKMFLERWYSFSVINILLVILAIALYRMNLVHYSIFTSICVPNVFMLAFGIMQMKKNIKWASIISILNIIAVAALGGRTAAVVCVFMVLFSYMFSSRITVTKKVLFFSLLILVTVCFIININDILLWLNNFFAERGIKSRSITLMMEQLKSKKIYLTNRDMIYSITWEYVKNRFGMPGGFGVALNLTEGVYYYTHNIFLQMFVLVGIPGTIIISMIIGYKFYRYKGQIDPDVYRLLVFLFVSYFVIGMTGSSIFIHFMATIFIAIFFFDGAKKEYVEAV